MEGVVCNTEFNPVIASIVEKEDIPDVKKYIEETLIEQRKRIDEKVKTAKEVFPRIKEKCEQNVELDIIFGKIDKFVTPIIEKIYEVFGKFSEWLKMLTTYLKQEIKDISEKIEGFINGISVEAEAETNKPNELREFLDNKTEGPPNSEINLPNGEVKEQRT